MRIHTSIIVGGALVVLGLGGCGGADTTTPQTPTAVATSAAPSEPATGQGCEVADKTGTSTNAELQDFAWSEFDSLDCAGATELTTQLKALAKDADFKATVADQGWTSDVGEALGGVSVSIVDLDTRSACRITVLDSPAKAKTVDCQDA